MDYSDEAVLFWARKIGEGTISNRAELEARFTPLIRLVMRTGRGRPALVSWLRRNLSTVSPCAGLHNPTQAEWLAPRMARLLCAQLLQRTQREFAIARLGETVVGE